MDARLATKIESSKHIRDGQDFVDDKPWKNEEGQRMLAKKNKELHRVETLQRELHSDK